MLAAVKELLSRDWRVEIRPHLYDM